MFELRVLNGLHQGAALPLAGELWRLGSDAAQDLALYDQGIEAQHCCLDRVDDIWTLRAEQGVIRDDEGHAFANLALTPNLAFMLGSVWLCVSSAETPWPSVPAVMVNATESGNDTETRSSVTPADASLPGEKIRSGSRLLNRTTGIVIGLLIGIGGSAWSLTRSSPPMIDPLLGRTAQSLPASNPAKPSSVAETNPDSRIRLANIQDARRQLSTMLNDRLLSGVDVQTTAEGLVLNGNLKEESLVIYQRMLKRFNDMYRSPVALLDNVSTTRNGLPFVIVQIMSGPQAHLVTADGHRLYIGDELEGLRLTHIDDQHIQFEGDRNYELSW